jgi:hypothetical protein
MTSARDALGRQAALGPLVLAFGHRGSGACPSLPRETGQGLLERSAGPDGTLGETRVRAFPLAHIRGGAAANIPPAAAPTLSRKRALESSARGISS